MSTLRYLLPGTENFKTAQRMAPKFSHLYSAIKTIEAQADFIKRLQEEGCDCDLGYGWICGIHELKLREWK